MNRVPPHSKEAEKSLLGILIMFPEKISLLGDRLKPTDFYAEKNRVVYEKMLDMSSGDVKIDLVSLSANLEGKIDASYLSSLLDTSPVASGLDQYFKLVKEKSYLRDVISKASSIALAAYSGDFMETSGALANLGVVAHIEGQQKSIAAMVRDWIPTTTGKFSVSKCFKELSFATKKEKSAARTALHRLKEEGLITAVSKEDGIYRMVDKECEEIDWRSANMEPKNIALPFGLNNVVNVFPGNVIVIAGENNRGKTAFMFDIIKNNMNNHEIHYFAKEGGPSEIKLRVGKHDDVSEEEWRFHAWDRSTDFADVIRPNDINLIDYISATEDEAFFVVGNKLEDIDNKLEDGLAFVALHKSEGKKWGHGGEFTGKVARLYLTMNTIDGNWSYIKIVKAKFWSGERSPEGMIIKYTFRGDSAQFVYTDHWHYPEKDELSVDSKKIYG